MKINQSSNELSMNDVVHAGCAFCAMFLSAYMNIGDVAENYPEADRLLKLIGLIEMAQLDNPIIAAFDPDMFVRELERKGYTITDRFSSVI